MKHVGRIIKSNKKIVVAYRVIPGDPNHCLVIPIESLMAEESQSLMKLVESHMGQNAYELADAMFRSTLPDGHNMLTRFSTTGKLLKMQTREIELIPDSYSSVNLAELNEMIAQQKGCTVDELAVKDTSKKETKKSDETAKSTQQSATTQQTQQDPQTPEEPLSDEDLARSYRAQADALYKEAKQLRAEADKLSPRTRKKKSDKAEVTDAKETKVTAGDH